MQTEYVSRGVLEIRRGVKLWRIAGTANGRARQIGGIAQKVWLEIQINDPLDRLLHTDA